jgi:hypothetical protein
VENTCFTAVLQRLFRWTLVFTGSIWSGTGWWVFLDNRSNVSRLTSRTRVSRVAPGGHITPRYMSVGTDSDGSRSEGIIGGHSGDLNKVTWCGARLPTQMLPEMIA